MRKFLFGLAIWLGALASAVAQVNVVPQIGVSSASIRQQTYSAISRALVPAASATDIFCIGGSSTRSIGIHRIEISGTAGTLVNAPFTLVKRVSLDSGGTAATTTALPVASTHVAGNAASTASLIAYTANPTINDTSPLYYRSSWVALPTTAAGTVQNSIIWEFGTFISAYDQGLGILAGTTTTQYCINLNAVSVSSGVLDISIEWIEQ